MKLGDLNRQQRIICKININLYDSHQHTSDMQKMKAHDVGIIICNNGCSGNF